MSLILGNYSSAYYQGRIYVMGSGCTWPYWFFIKHIVLICYQQILRLVPMDIACDIILVFLFVIIFHFFQSKYLLNCKNYCKILWNLAVFKSLKPLLMPDCSHGTFFFLIFDYLLFSHRCSIIYLYRLPVWLF